MADQGRSIGNLCSWLIKVTSNGGHPNTAYSPLHDIPYWKQQTKVNVLLTSAAVLWYPKVTSNWGHPHDTYLLLHDTFLKTANQWQSICDLCSWFMLRPKVTSSGGHPKNTYLPQHDIPFWKWQTKENALVTSSADFGDLQSDLQLDIFRQNAWIQKKCLDTDEKNGKMPTFGWKPIVHWWPLQLI